MCLTTTPSALLHARSALEQAEARPATRIAIESDCKFGFPISY
jgi:hypothetical protein